MKNYLFHIGIDISKLKLDVNILNVSSFACEHFVIENNPKAIADFMKIISKKGIDIKKSLFCCEKFVNKEIFKEIANLNKSLTVSIRKTIKKIETRIKEIIQSNEKLKTQSQLIQSIPGIGELTSLYFIVATKGFSAFENWRKFACYSGVAPFEYSSGSSVRGRTKVNHLADKKMKSLLQMCTMTSIKYDAQLKEYYNKKKAEGKNPMLVLNNIRCKLISRVFAVISRETPYINTYKFTS